MSSTPFHVVIIGGGIGGLCLAQGLKARGVSVTVYERNPSDRWLEGYRIHINPIGSRALHECLPPVLWEAFVASAGKPPAGMGFLTEQLKELVVIADEFMSDKTNDPVNAHYPVSRIALRHLLLSGLEDEIQYDKTFERYERTQDGKVTAYFNDGTSATGDVLVGADGANSRVRKQYLPHARRIEIGASGVGGKFLLTKQSKAWLPSQLTTRMNFIMPPDRYCLFNAPFDHVGTSAEARNRAFESAKIAGLNPDLLIDDEQDYILWGFLAHTDEYPADMQQFDKQSILRTVIQMTRGWHPDLRRFVAESDPDSLSFGPFKASEIIHPWESTNVTLLGDAIHNMPPSGGLGGNMALRDAQALTRALTGIQHDQLPLLPTIQAYEAEMRKHGFAAIRAALGYAQMAITNNRFTRGASRAWFQACNAIPPLKRSFEEKWTEPMRNQEELTYAGSRK
ncbi:MAG TPA: NAD(P)/FAD-dependent oxidoreductase [Ktedonobacteraceae bacterium]|jgi:2-polyprenyl-6-methoxyphenol hydroxylase-like FAD-dependent oxidoreductase|nr:NAD(P)/FAD-dependent oxidoreductase [Ktedonobacteraceae bacterium]